MALKIRLARRGSKKRPFYHVVVADSRMPRDGRYLEKLGTYNPLLPKDSEERVQVNMERVKYWLGEGAQPTDRVSRFLEASGELDKKTRSNPKKGTPGKAAQDRAEARAAKVAELKDKAEEVVEDIKDGLEHAAEVVEEKIEEIKEKIEEAKEEKAEEKAEEAAADAPAEDAAPAEEAPAEDAPAEEAKAEE